MVDGVCRVDCTCNEAATLSLTAFFRREHNMIRVLNENELNKQYIVILVYKRHLFSALF